MNIIRNIIISDLIFNSYMKSCDTVFDRKFQNGMFY
jgi:hypothetical protein